MELVKKYAIHNSGISFHLKKIGDNFASVNTQLGATIEDNIRLLYGYSISKELIHITCKKYEESLKFNFKAYITNPSYNEKKFIFILFINSNILREIKFNFLFRQTSRI